MCGFIRNVTERRGVKPEMSKRTFYDSFAEWFSFTDVGKICLFLFLFYFVILYCFKNCFLTSPSSSLFPDMESVSPTLSKITIDLPACPNPLPPPSSSPSLSPPTSPHRLYSPFLSAFSFEGTGKQEAEISGPMKVVKKSLMEKALLLGGGITLLLFYIYVLCFIFYILYFFIFFCYFLVFSLFSSYQQSNERSKPSNFRLSPKRHA